MALSSSGAARALEAYRGYLCVIARAQLASWLQAKVDPSDVVQQTLLDAHESRDAFRGTTERQRLVWLRKILAANIAKTVRHYRAQKRDVRIEVALEASLGDSSARLEGWLQADAQPPSEEALRAEKVLELARHLSELPAEQQEVLVLHYCEGWPLERIGARSGRSPAAVASLAYRGMQRLRTKLRGMES